MEAATFAVWDFTNDIQTEGKMETGRQLTKCFGDTRARNDPWRDCELRPCLALLVTFSTLNTTSS